MPGVKEATLEKAIERGLDLASNAFLFIHGWVATPLLMEFVKFVPTLKKTPCTAEELAAKEKVGGGPLGITLRTAAILGYAHLDPKTDKYSVVEGPELNELEEKLKPNSTITNVFSEIFNKSVPPFRLPTDESTRCFKAWVETRPLWEKSKSKSLSILLDGVILAPILTSLTYFHRWDEQGLDSQFGKVDMSKIDCTKFDSFSKDTLAKICKELQIGTVDQKGVLTPTSKGSLGLQRCYSYYVPTSYSPMLGKFPHILHTDASWGFVGSGQDTLESEIHVQRTLNVVGSGAQHRTFFKDLTKHISPLFSTSDFAKQPDFVADTGSGDGHLLMAIYEFVKDKTPRGKVLDKYPLTMVGIDYNEESRVATSVNLAQHNVPHIVVFGDIGDPKTIIETIKGKGVDPNKTLHVRSFLDHDRPYIAPKEVPPAGSPAEIFARQEFLDVVHVDKYGKAIKPLEVFASLAEHFDRWGEALEGSFGLIVLEVMILDVPTTKRFINDNVSFHFDIVQCLSRQYMVSPVSWGMAAAMGGMLPVDIKKISCYPEEALYCRVVNQHFVKQPFKIRFASPSDIDQLEKLEKEVWGDLGVSRDGLLKRIEVCPTGCFVCTTKGFFSEKIIAALYTQRIDDIKTIDKQKFQELYKTHQPGGKIIQLIAIASDPSVKELSVGENLRAFALHLARVDPTAECVIGVTRAMRFKESKGSMDEYLKAHNSGANVDPIVDFHTGFGAQAIRTVPNFRPEDKDNGGVGILIQYDVKEMSTMGKRKGGTSSVSMSTSSVSLTTGPVKLRAKASVESATFDQALAKGLNLSTNAFLLIHGWVSVPMLMEFVKCLPVLKKKSCTCDELAKEMRCNPGPLGIVLRTAAILGYVQSDGGSQGKYTPVNGTDLDELESKLKPNTAITRAIENIYQKAVPPFRMGTDQSSICFLAWRETRPLWSDTKSKYLQILLDGVVLAPILTSLTYFHRWDEKGLDSQFGKVNMDTIDCTKLDSGSRGTLGEIIEKLSVGKMKSDGMIETTKTGSLALQRCYSYYVPTSYSPMLGVFKEITFENSGWGFVGTGQDTNETEIHVERTLNVVGSGAQHRTFFKDLSKHIKPLFDGEKFDQQPSFIADTGSGDGHLLMEIYEFIKEKTPRGKVLDKHPLTMVGVDFNEESRVATSVNLAKHDIPHIVVFGDIGDPATIIDTIKKKGVDPNKTLHVRSFLDHDRPYIAPSKVPQTGSAEHSFALKEFIDVVHLDKHGTAVKPLEVFASLAEHFDRWGNALEGSFGLIMLEVMILDVETTQRFFNDNVSFHFDIVQCLSRQYMVSPVSFAMSAAMSGMLPTDVKKVNLYPEFALYCRVMNQHFVRRPFKVRFASPSDIDALEPLEKLVWGDLGVPKETLLKRIQVCPTGCFVCTVQDRVVAALYTQRVSNLEVLDKQRFQKLHETHEPDGNIVQLIAIATHPDVSEMRIGEELRNFALHLARLDPTVDCVIGVTRCQEFKNQSSSMEEYVEQHMSGMKTDPIVDFHTGYGADVIRTVHNFRPEDTDNKGTGVLIMYNVKDLPNMKMKSLAMEPVMPVSAPVGPQVSAINMIKDTMADVGYPLKGGDEKKGFMQLGLDSLELVRVRNQMGCKLSTELPATLLLDYPTVADLSAHFDKKYLTSGPSGGAVVSTVSSIDMLKSTMRDVGYDLHPGDERKGFMQLGLDSLELVRVRNQMGCKLSTDLPATLLLDYPTVGDLAAHLDKKYNKARGPGPGPGPGPGLSSIEMLKSTMRDVGYDLQPGDERKGFMQLGLDSLELVRVRNQMGCKLSAELPATLLLDYPTVGDLAAFLDKNYNKAQARGSAPRISSMELLKSVMSDVGYDLTAGEERKGFMQLGLDSLELVRVRNQMGSKLSADLPATLLLDYPTVGDLATHLDKIYNKGPSKTRGPAQVGTMAMLKEVLSDIGYDISAGQENKGFMALGLDSLELVRVRNNLGKKLGSDLSATLLLDHPTLQNLAEHLDKERGIGADDEDLIPPEDILAIQADVKEACLSAEYQKQFDDMAAKCYPKKFKYIKDIEPIVIELERPIFVKHGLLSSDTSEEAVQKVRATMLKSIQDCWATNKQIQDNANELLQITKQDQYWGPQSIESICDQLGIDYETLMAEVQKQTGATGNPFAGR